MIGFRTGTAPSVRVRRSTLRARDMDAIELALEGARVLAQRHRHEWPADRRDLHAARHFLAVDAEIGQHAADALGLGVVALFDRVERCGLAGFDAVERSLQPRQRALDAGGRGLDGGGVLAAPSPSAARAIPAALRGRAAR